MQKQNVDFSIMFTPWTIDTYSTFTFDSTEEYILECEKERKLNGWDWYEGKQSNEDVSYDDYDWTYNHKGYVQSLANNWLLLTKDNIIDSVILDIAFDGEAYSPREYNFSTDNASVIFTIDVDELDKYIKDNQADYDKNHIRSYSGFMWFGDDVQTKLHYYLHNKSVNDLREESYLMAQYDDVPTYDFIDYTLIEK